MGRMMKWLVGVVLALPGLAWAAPPAGAGTPEAYYAQLPSLPKSIGEALKMCPTLDARKSALDEAAKAATPPATSPPPPPPAGGVSREEMDFMGGFAKLGQAQGEKINNYYLEKQRIGAVEQKCLDALTASNPPDTRPGQNKCMVDRLASLGPIYDDMLKASHDLVVLKANYIGDWKKKAKDASLKYKLTFLYGPGLWAYPGNVLALWADSTCGAFAE
jgi:hypothetical protein